MNRRISLASIVTRLKQQVPRSLGVNHIGSSLDFDFLESVGDASKWPAGWVGAQRSTPLDDGRGYSGRARQLVRVEFACRVIVKRYVAGEASEEDQLNRICDAVADALMGWTPGNGVQPLVWVQSIDGPPEQSVMTADLLFATEVTYQYAHAA